MVQNKQVALRFKLLQSDIEEINKCYNDTLRDPWVDCGMEYNKSTPYNEKSIKMLNQLLYKGEALQKQREEVLNGKIIHFSQTFYLIKEYLKDLYPQHKSIVEDFFSNEQIDGTARKDISNDLKHESKNDLVLKNPKPAIEITPTTNTIIINNQKKWFYFGKDSVEYCNQLYNELVAFLKENNF